METNKESDKWTLVADNEKYIAWCRNDEHMRVERDYFRDITGEIPSNNKEEVYILIYDKKTTTGEWSKIRFGVFKDRETARNYVENRLLGEVIKVD